MKVAFRADASSHIGTGHIARSMALAKELRRRGAETLFISRALPGQHVSLPAREGFAVATLPGTGLQAPQSEDYAAWRGVSEEQDARETIAAAGSCDWLLADHYGLNQTWESRVRACADKIAVIDDLNRPHNADLVIDQNVSERPSRYTDVPAAARKLLGPAFGLLGEEYRSGPRVQIREKLARIFVFFGGADPQGAVVAAVEALSGPAFSDIHFDVVVGAASPHRTRLETWAAQRGRAAVHTGVPSLRDLMAAADLAIGGGGTTMLERCCLGLPTVVLTVADNQVPGTRALATTGAIVHLGDFANGIGRLADTVAALAADVGARRAISEQAQLLVDGWGAARVAEQIMPTPASALALRPAEKDDCPFYFQLVNDPEVRRNSFQSAVILWEEHKRWFAVRRTAADTWLRVMTALDLPVGQIRLVLKDGHAYVDYSLDPLVRGRGWGRDIIVLGLRAFFADHDTPVRAEVKHGNLPSRAIFERLGFRSAATEHDGMVAYEMDRPTFTALDQRA